MKKSILFIGLLLITKLCFSQFSVGAGYVNNHSSSRRYSKTLSGIDVDLKYNLSDRFSLSSDMILYNNVTTSQIRYKTVSVDLNGELNVIKKEVVSFYCILGLDILQSSVTALDPSMVSPFGNANVKSTLFRVNLGLGAQYKIFKNVWLRLNIIKNSDNELIVNPGLSYRFKLPGSE